MNVLIPSSTRGGCLIRGLLVLAFLAVIGVAAWIVLLPGILVSTIQARTGFVVKVEHLSINPFVGRVEISGAVVENPAGWPTQDFLKMRQFTVDAELRPLLENRLVADKLVIDVERLSIVRNQSGITNAEAFRSAMNKGGAESAESPGKPARTSFLIRHLVLKFNRLTVADYSGKKPLIKNYELGIERELYDVDSVSKLLSPFVGVAFNATRGLFDAPQGFIDQTINSLQQTGKKTGESLKKFFQSLEKKEP